MYIHAGMWKAFVTVLSTVGPLCIAVLLAENIQRTPFFCTPSRRYPPLTITHTLRIFPPFHISPPFLFSFQLPVLPQGPGQGGVPQGARAEAQGPPQLRLPPRQQGTHRGTVKSSAVWKCGVECVVEGCRFIFATLLLCRFPLFRRVRSYIYIQVSQPLSNWSFFTRPCSCLCPCPCL